MASSTTQPPDYLLPCLHSIETAVLLTYREHPKLVDKDVEDTYEQLKVFFQKVAQGKELPEPTSSRTIRQDLISSIINELEFREELEEDGYIIDNPAFQYNGRPIPYIESLYAVCFNILLGSVRRWRKELGKSGYLKFIEDQIP